MQKYNIPNQTFGRKRKCTTGEIFKVEMAKGFLRLGIDGKLRSMEDQRTKGMVRDRFEYILFETQEMRDEQKTFDYSHWSVESSNLQKKKERN